MIKKAMKLFRAAHWILLLCVILTIGMVIASLMVLIKGDTELAKVLMTFSIVPLAIALLLGTIEYFVVKALVGTLTDNRVFSFFGDIYDRFFRKN